MADISLLALDLAKTSGITHWATGMAMPYASELKLDKPDIGDRLAMFYKWLLRNIRQRKVTDIAVESPITAAGSQEKIIWLVSAYGVVLMAGKQCNVWVEPVANSDWFPHFAGSNQYEGEERKARSIVEVTRRGLPPTIIQVQRPRAGLVNSHDIADSIGVMTYRLFKLGITAPWDTLLSPGPLFEVPGGGGLRITKGNQRAAALAIKPGLSFDREDK